jgi:hypothetical protein
MSDVLDVSDVFSTLSIVYGIPNVHDIWEVSSTLSIIRGIHDVSCELISYCPLCEVCTTFREVVVFCPLHELRMIFRKVVLHFSVCEVYSMFRDLVPHLLMEVYIRVRGPILRCPFLRYRQYFMS